MKRTKLVMCLLVVIFSFGSLVTFSSLVDAASKASLEKQVKDLKAENKKLKAENSKLKQQNSSKDKEIKKQKDKVSSRDKEIKNLKSKVVKPLDDKLNYQGTIKSGNYNISNKSVPVLLNYNGVPYAPVQLLGSIYNVGSTYNSKLKTWYLGEGSNGLNMSDLLKPYVGDFNKDDLILGGIEYKSGYRFFTSGYNGPYSNSFNLQGKYATITGLLGIADDSDSLNSTSVSFYGDGNLIQTYNLIRGELPINISLPVKGVKRLELRMEESDMVGYAVWANVKIN
ncbi:NPCBM/NEW2 domain-containing protein [Niallia sp. 03133]|uniref:NPCBM/NEW2 domain-containing protein n=1 Tax=Niallia sp. 03133 TaxID=3458060 RepID=UPI004043FCF6